MDEGTAAWGDVADAVAALVGPVGDPHDLGGSDRSHVWRVNGATGSLVVKQHLQDEPFAREAAALDALTGTGVAPDLVGRDRSSRLLVMEDVRGDGDLATALLGNDRPLATSRLEEWVRAVARLHAAVTPEVVSRFTEQLHDLGPDLRADELEDTIELAVQGFREELPGLGLDAAPLDALPDLPSRLGPARVLSPTDACPDNNLAADGVVRLLDFEGARLWHPAWDVAYLRVPFPSCWCSWALPEDVVRRAEEHYRGAVELPAGFDDDLELVTLAWCLVSVGWFLPRALHPRDGDDQDPRIPARRQMVQHRLRLASTSRADVRLAAVAGQLHDRLAEEWGEVVLPLGPVWRPGG